jgi:hypothetical protein
MVIQDNYIPILAITIPAVIFIIIIAINPKSTIVNLSPKSQSNFYTIDDKYNEDRANKAKEIDQILEKIHKKGLKSLSSKEKSILEEYSKK